MSSKKQTDWAESARNAATGYAVVVLSIVCFILALVVVVAGVRIIVGPNAAANNMAATATSVATSTVGNGTA